ncbi:unnamed protein product [Ceratitis capitata]|uniref:(Mediterranean fruit fly) hypothetical protein n=1 Tax=Ceratitis capitata TaxID=7213 RepID=A0A811UG17_CERCA|nr:unnamed protein product [Ceratitis capitata]
MLLGEGGNSNNNINNGHKNCNYNKSSQQILPFTHFLGNWANRFTVGINAFVAVSQQQQQQTQSAKVR